MKSPHDLGKLWDCVFDLVEHDTVVDHENERFEPVDFFRFGSANN